MTQLLRRKVVKLTYIDALMTTLLAVIFVLSQFSFNAKSYFIGILLGGVQTILITAQLASLENSKKQDRVYRICTWSLQAMRLFALAAIVMNLLGLM